MREVGLGGMEPLFEFQDEGGGFGVGPELDQGASRWEFFESGNFFFPVAENKSFEIGSFMIGEVAARSVGDQDMELFVKGGGRGGGGKISDLFFAVEDDEKEDYEPEDAQRDDEFFVASEFFGRHGF